MTAIDNEATTISNKSEEATEIVDNNTSATQEDQILENETLATPDEEDKSKHKVVKTVGGIAVGGAVLGGAASVFMNIADDSSVEITEDSAEEDNVVIAAEMVELPEVIVEALAAKNEETINTTSSAEVSEDMATSPSETLYAEVSDPKPYKGDQPSDTPAEQVETITAQTAVKPEEDTLDTDIPIVSVGNLSDSESDIQILGVTQDISTGYNVGHLSVDGEEVVVIDVDGDMVFDSVVVDLNHDGDITSDEIIDISQHSLSLEDISGNSDFFNSLTSTGDTPDYLSEMVE